MAKKVTEEQQCCTQSFHLQKCRLLASKELKTMHQGAPWLALKAWKIRRVQIAIHLHYKRPGSQMVVRAGALHLHFTSRSYLRQSCDPSRLEGECKHMPDAPIWIILHTSKECAAGAYWLRGVQKPLCSQLMNSYRREKPAQMPAVSFVMSVAWRLLQPNQHC